tara:strand:- start:254 stop:493 length:240 start_codon:yes stop_codon:yes gene_type:complete
MSELDSLMTDFDWIDFYLGLREIESEGTSLKRNYMMRIAREKYEIAQVIRPIDASVLYINDLYRKYIYSPGVLFSLTPP